MLSYIRYPQFASAKLSPRRGTELSRPESRFLQSPHGDLPGKLHLIRKIIEQIRSEMKHGDIRLTNIRDAYPGKRMAQNLSPEAAALSRVPELTFTMAGREYKLSQFEQPGDQQFALAATDGSLVLRYLKRPDPPAGFVYYEVKLLDGDPSGTRMIRTGQGDGSTVQILQTGQAYPGDEARLQPPQILQTGQDYPTNRPFPDPQLQADTKHIICELLMAIRARILAYRLGEGQKSLSSPAVLDAIV